MPRPTSPTPKSNVKATTKVTAKSNYHHGDLRAALLSAARAILEQQGVAELSLREAAKLANVSPAAPYRHFPNKEALLAVLAEDGFLELDQAIRRAALRNPDQPLRQLEEMAAVYLRLAAQHPHFFRMMFSVNLGPSRVTEGIVRNCDKVYLGLLQMLRASLPSSVPASKLEQAFLLYWSTLHGYAMLLIDHKLDDLGLSLEQHCVQIGALISAQPTVHPAQFTKTRPGKRVGQT